MHIGDPETEHTFTPLHKRLKALEQRLNVGEQNLHFGGTLTIRPGDFDDLLTLAEDGLTAVQQHHAHFSRRPLYGDGMFWYDLFLLISTASLQEKSGWVVSESVLRRLVEVLVDISQYSLVHDGDIVNRNRGALGNLLCGFPLPSLRVQATERSMQSPKVREFVAWTLEAVERVSRR